MSTTTHPADINGSYVTPDGKAQIDFGITYRNAKGVPEFHASGYYDGSAGQCLDEIAKAYPKDPWVLTIGHAHLAHHLKQVDDLTVKIVHGWALQHPARDFYDHQAQSFLSSNGLKLRATLADSKPAPWSDGGKNGHHYRVTIWRGRLPFYDDQPEGYQESARDFQNRTYGSPLRITFDFWDSIANAEEGTAPTAYDVLACIASDAHCPFTFNDFCAEYGYDSDSLKDKQTFNRCASFARRLRAFFTPAEIEQLSAIQ